MFGIFNKSFLIFNPSKNHNVVVWSCFSPNDINNTVDRIRLTYVVAILITALSVDLIMRRILCNKHLFQKL